MVHLQILSAGADRVCNFCGGHGGGDQPRAFRLTGSRIRVDGGIPYRIQRVPLVFILPGRILGDDRSVVHRGYAVAGWMDAAVPELAERRNGKSGVLAGPRGHVSISGRDHVLQHGADAQASAVQDSDDWVGGIRRGAGGDRPDPVYSWRARPHSGHLLVLSEGCRVHVPLYLVSWHVPALSL